MGKIIERIRYGRYVLLVGVLSAAQEFGNSVESQEGTGDEKYERESDEGPKQEIHDVISSMRPRVINVEPFNRTPRACISERSRRPPASTEVRPERSTIMGQPEHASFVHV